MKKLANLKGAKALKKQEQKTILGGHDGIRCSGHSDCPTYSPCCYVGFCRVNPNPGSDCFDRFEI